MRIKKPNVFFICTMICSLFMYHVAVWNSYPIWNVFIVIMYAIIAYIVVIKKQSKVVNGYLRWGVLFLGIGVIVSLIQPYKAEGFINIINILKIFIPVYAISLFAVDEDHHLIIIQSLWFAGVVVSINLFQNFDVSEILGVKVLTQARMGLGGIEHPNTTAYNLLISFGCGLCILDLYSKKVSKKLFVELILLIGEIVIGIGCLFTGSRKVLVGIVILLTLYMILKSKNPLKTIRSLVCCFIIAIVSYQIILNNHVLYTLIGNRMESMFSGEDASSSGRNKLIWDSINVGLNSVIGVGMGNYSKYNSEGYYTHNEICEIFTSIGFMGIIAYYAPILRSTWSCLKKCKKNKFAKQIPWICLIICMLIMEYYQVTYSLYSYHVLIALLLVAKDQIFMNKNVIGSN